MARYADVADCTDPAITVTDQHLLQADSDVDGDLRKLGLTTADIAALTLPNAQLTALAVAYASRVAALDGAIGEQSPLLDKARQYATLARERAARLTREALGLDAPTGGYGTVEIGRG